MYTKVNCTCIAHCLKEWEKGMDTEVPKLSLFHCHSDPKILKYRVAAGHVLAIGCALEIRNIFSENY